MVLRLAAFFHHTRILTSIDVIISHDILIFTIRLEKSDVVDEIGIVAPKPNPGGGQEDSPPPHHGVTSSLCTGGDVII